LLHKNIIRGIGNSCDLIEFEFKEEMIIALYINAIDFLEKDIDSYKKDKPTFM